jgi:hypothetical protein
VVAHRHELLEHGYHQERARGALLLQRAMVRTSVCTSMSATHLDVPTIRLALADRATLSMQEPLHLLRDRHPPRLLPHLAPAPPREGEPRARPLVVISRV